MSQNNKSKSVSQEQEGKYAEQNFKNMIWFYRKELSKIHHGKTIDQLGLSYVEVRNLTRQEILILTYTLRERIYLTGKYRKGNGRIYVLTEKARLILKEIAISEK